MQRLRSLHHKQKYTQIANDAIDALPSLEAVGLLATILRHNDDFDFQMSVLIKSKPGLGEQKAYKARTTLIEYGYLVQVKFKHTYRGRMCTDIYRASEPHAATDLALLRERYTPGSEATITDDDGRERQVTIIWSEITSTAGAEEVRTTDAVDNSTPNGTSDIDTGVKLQVAPDPGFPGPGNPGPGQPGPGQPGPGQPGSHKEEGVEDEKEHQHQAATAAAGGGEALEEEDLKDEGDAHPLANQARDLLQQVRDGYAQGLRPHQPYVDAIAAQLAAGYDRDVILKVITDGLETFQNRAAGAATNIRDLTARLAEIGSRSGSQGLKWAPEWCGQCDREGRDKPNLRRTEDAQGRPMRCSRCHPDVAATP